MVKYIFALLTHKRCKHCKFFTHNNKMKNNLFSSGGGFCNRKFGLFVGKDVNDQCCIYFK